MEFIEFIIIIYLLGYYFLLALLVFCLVLRME